MLHLGSSGYNFAEGGEGIKILYNFGNCCIKSIHEEKGSVANGNGAIDELNKNIKNYLE